MDRNGWPLFGWYVWDKGFGMPGNWNGRLAPAHEFVFHFNRESVKSQKTIPTMLESRVRSGKWTMGFRKEGGFQAATSPEKCGQATKIPDSVIRLTREQARGIHTQSHSAVFPVDLPSHIIAAWPGRTYEPFAGSGTTAVACEQLGRECRMMEIDPGYSAVALERLAGMGCTAEIVK